MKTPEQWKAAFEKQNRATQIEAEDKEVLHEVTRDRKEILKAYKLLHDNVWALGRKDNLTATSKKAVAKIDPDYGVRDLSEMTELEAGILMGRMSALRWALGTPWEYSGDD